MRHSARRLVLAATILAVPGCATSSTSIGHSVVVTNEETAAPEHVAAPDDGPAKDVAAIRAIRDTLNQALAARDADTFQRFWAEDATTVGGNGGAQAGRDRNAAEFRQFFSDSSFVAGYRTAERVAVETGTVRRRPMAAEEGRWVWRVRGAAGVTEYRGRYLVQWQRLAEGWRIRAEQYVTTACVSGPGC